MYTVGRGWLGCWVHPPPLWDVGWRCSWDTPRKVQEKHASMLTQIRKPEEAFVHGVMIVCFCSVSFDCAGLLRFAWDIPREGKSGS